MARTRLDGVDLARAVALVGMMLVHVVLTVDLETGDPSVVGMVAAGRAAPLFALLAGLSLCLVRSRDPQGAGSPRAVAVRAAVLLVLGVLLGSMESVTVLVILAYYGLMLLLVLPFLSLPTRALGVAAAAWLLLAPPLHLGLLNGVGAQFRGQLELSDLADPGQALLELTVTGFYSPLVWTGYVLAGAWLGRLALGRVEVAVRLLVGGALLAVAANLAGLAALRSGALDGVLRDTSWRGLFAPWWSVEEVTDPVRLLVVGEHTSSTLNVLASTGTAVAVVGLCLLVTHLPGARTALAPLLAAGAMPLSLYTLHVLWLTWENAGGWVVAEDRHLEWLAQVVVLVLAAWVWRRWYGRGPLEQLVRTLSVPAR